MSLPMDIDGKVFKVSLRIGRLTMGCCCVYTHPLNVETGSAACAPALNRAQTILNIFSYRYLAVIFTGLVGAIIIGDLYEKLFPSVIDGVELAATASSCM